MELNNITIQNQPYDTYYVVSISSTLVILSFLLILLILTSKQLRSQKEYILLVFNLIHEFVYGVAWLAGGSHRLVILYRDIDIPMSTRGSCFFTLFVVLFVITFPGSGLMCLTMAIDRMLSVFMPFRYLGFSVNYAVRTVVIGYSPAFLILIASIIIVYSNEAYRNAPTFGVCEISGGTFPIINEMIRGVQLGTTIIGMILYIPITIKLVQVFRPGGKLANLNTAQRRNLIRYNCIVSLMVANEMLLIVIPHIILIFSPTTDARYVLFVSNLVKGLVNVVIIFVPQKELRHRCFKIIINLFMTIFCVDKSNFQPSNFTVAATQISHVTAFRTGSSRRTSTRMI